MGERDEFQDSHGRQHLWHRVISLFYSSKKRLEADILWLEQRMGAYKDVDDRDKRSRAGEVSEFLEKAREAIKRNDINGGWKCLNEAMRRETFLLDDAEVDARAISLEKESVQKLTNWRKESVVEILSMAKKHKMAMDAKAADRAEGPAEDAPGGEQPGEAAANGADKGIKDPPAGDPAKHDKMRRELLVEAMAIRDGHFDNLYFRKELVRSRMFILSIAMTALVIGFVFLSSFVGTPESCLTTTSGSSADGTTESKFNNCFQPSNFQLLLGSFLLGAIGACLSGLMSFASKERIPDQFASVWVTIARPIIGAASGLVAVFFANVGIFSFPHETASIWALAVAFGFSERLVLGTMQKIGE